MQEQLIYRSKILGYLDEKYAAETNENNKKIIRNIILDIEEW